MRVIGCVCSGFFLRSPLLTAMKIPIICLDEKTELPLISFVPLRFDNDCIEAVLEDRYLFQ